MNNIEQQIIETRKKLDKWSKEYYDNNNSPVSDTTYDAELRKLHVLEAQRPDLITKDSPTQRVGGSLSKKFKKVPHEFPMMSLDNAFDAEDLIQFDKHIKTTLGLNKEFEYVLEYKIDGLSISIIYEDGILSRALTRGDGSAGEDVTSNILMIESIPKVIDYKQKLTVRGEVFFRHAQYNEINDALDDSEKFANPRNAAAGTLRQLDSSVVKERKLSCFLYSIPNPNDHNIFTQSEVLDFLESHKFPIYKERKLMSSIDGIINFVNNFDKDNSGLDFDIDGLVVKLNDTRLYEDVGYTTKFPKFMTAYKLKEEVVITKLLDIFPTVGRTGRITYNAKLEPVQLGGSTVSAATLHNADYITSNEINKGDEVEVKKAGEIIPKVIGLYQKHSEGSWTEATECPSCGTTLMRPFGEVDQYCFYEKCKAKQIAALEHFVSKKAMNIEGLSTEQLIDFYERGWIEKWVDIFDIESHKEELLNTKGYKLKSVEKLIDSINTSKHQPLSRFLFALGIRHVGEKISKTLTKRYPTIKHFKNLDIEKLSAIRDIGNKVIESLISYFSKQENWRDIEKAINEKGLTFEISNENLSEKLNGATFVITGTLSKPREQFVKLIESNGGNVSSAVSSRTTFLLCGEEAGSKKDKALKLGVKILSEEEFMKEIGE